MESTGINITNTIKDFKVEMDPLSEIRNKFSNSLSKSDIEKYIASGQNLYNMMNFDKLECPNEPENLIYVTKLLNTTNNLE